VSCCEFISEKKNVESQELGDVDEENSVMFISQHWIPNQNPKVEIPVQR